MGVHHIVLFKLKSGTTSDQIAELKSAVANMVGKVPGLIKIDIGAPLESTAARAKGFDFGLVALLEKADDVKVYAEHPEHQKVHKIRESLCDDTLAYDLVF